jgi:threonine dehydrogenase-like Zn-dependent dehydrogenase
MWAQTLVAPARFEMQDVQAPEEGDVGADEVLLRVLAGGICGSDLPYFKGAPQLGTVGGPHPYRPYRPGFPLHEVVGEVMVSRHPEVRVGTRVVGWASKTDAMSEYLIARGAGLGEYDPELPPATAILLQPLACVLYALEQVPDIEGARAAVIGLGPIGVLFAHALKELGASHVIGVDRVDRSDVAAAFGIDEPVHASSEVWAATLQSDASRPRIIVEAVGHQVTTLANAISALAFGGQIYYFGIPDDPVYPFPMLAFLGRNARLSSGFTPERDRRPSLGRAEKYLLAHPELKNFYVTNLFPFADAQAAFETSVVPAVGRLKVVMTAPGV